MSEPTIVTLLTEEEIRTRVGELAAQIRADYVGKPLTIVAILTGSLVFLADLIRRVDLPLKLGLLSASSYRGPTTTAAELRIVPDLLPDVRDRHVLLLDDILDTGKTLSLVVTHLQAAGALSVKTAVLLRKIGRQVVPLEPDYTGFEIPDQFVVGYGLDYDDSYRHLPFIGVIALSLAAGLEGN